jgi:murein DD-endopeptidase MepM/ murein hydrolase activator NlpD
LKPDGIRVPALVSYAAVAILATAALRIGFSGRGGRDEAATDDATTQWSLVDTLGRGETLAALLRRGGLSDGEAGEVLRASLALDQRRLPAGMEVRIAGDSTRAPDGRPSEVILQLSRDRAFRLTRDGESWSAHDERTPWSADTVAVRAVIHTNLYDALDDGAGALLPKGARTELAWAVADLYEYRIDMSRELQDGEAVRVVFERLRSPAGGVRIGTILAAGIQRRGGELQAIRYLPRGATREEYYDQDGRSMRAAFLRAPLSFRRISSVFGLRMHPILGEWRAHKGTDYAAAAGTAVRSIGDGVVVFAGARAGYGNSLDVRHANGFVTRYGHLRGFEAGVHRGARVNMGQTIGFVGMTGLATAPHLHFEVLVGGVQRDPRSALRENAGEPLPAGERVPFERSLHFALAALERPAVSAHAGRALR